MHARVCPCVCVCALLEGQGEVVLAGLAVPHQVTGLLAEPQEGLGVGAAHGPVVPAERKRDGAHQRAAEHHEPGFIEGLFP